MENNKIKSNIIGLDMGLAIGKFFLDSEDLHFGYWPNNEISTTGFHKYERSTKY